MHVNDPKQACRRRRRRRGPTHGGGPRIRGMSRRGGGTDRRVSAFSGFLYRERGGEGDELLSLLLWDRSAHERRLLI